MKSLQLIVAQGQAGGRLDKLVAESLPEMSRSRAQVLIKEGLVLVNGQRVRASYRVSDGDEIAIELPPGPGPVVPQPEPIPLELLYEDEHLIVVNKPAGLVVHAGPGHRSGTLVNALLYHRPQLAQGGLDPERPGIVHRLDRDTSGAIIVAADPEALSALQKQFRRREVDKRYLALVYGIPERPAAAIEAPITRDPEDRQRMTVAHEGRHARTEYQVMERFSDASLLEVRLLTGRTHQIRVHLASIGYPVVGDRTYGRRRESLGARRQMLHAWRLGFVHPATQERMTFTAPTPDDMERLLEIIRPG